MKEQVQLPELNQHKFTEKLKKKEKREKKERKIEKRDKRTHIRSLA